MPISKNRSTIINNYVQVTQSGGDHGDLVGLADNDHPQYLLTSSYETFSSSVATHIDDGTIHFTEASIDHGSISGLGDAADHPWAATTSSLAALSSSVATHIDDGTIHFVSGDIVHNDLSGLTVGDPHTQYILEDGSRAFSGDVSLGQNNILNVESITANTGNIDVVISDYITGSLTVIGDGSPYIQTIGGISILTQSNGSLQLSGAAGGVTDHGALTGLSDDDHSIYILVDGTRAFSGDQAFGANNITGVDTITANTGVFTAVTGAHSEVASGVPFILTDNGLSISTASNGQITVSGNPMSASIAAEINTLQSDVTALSGAVASDINEFRWISDTLDSTGDRTLSNTDNNSVIFMSGASANILRVPATLMGGFHCVAVQQSSPNIQVVATNTLTYPSTTFTSRSLEEGASIAIYSGSTDRLILGGILETV